MRKKKYIHSFEIFEPLFKLFSRVLFHFTTWNSQLSFLKTFANLKHIILIKRLEKMFRVETGEKRKVYETIIEKKIKKIKLRAMFPIYAQSTYFYESYAESS